MSSQAACIFCKIIKGEIPSFKLIETPLSYSYLDIQPLSKGHCLVIPKHHGHRLHDIPDNYLADILPVVKKLTHVLGLDLNDSLDGEGYNVLQNNGAIAHQVVEHVHFHLIPKRDEKTGLIVGWPAAETNFELLEGYHKELLEKLDACKNLITAISVEEFQQVSRLPSVANAEPQLREASLAE